MTEPTGWPHMLPCPFCGGDARHDAHADDCYFILHRKFKNSGADMSPAFEVLAAWNRRAVQPSPTPQADSQPAPVVDREAVIRAAVAAMPHTNPMVADDLLGGFTMHTEADDVIAIFEAGRAARTPADSQPAPDPADVIAGALQTSRGHAIELMQQAVDADRAARAPADSVTAPAGGVADGWKWAPEEPTLYMGWAYLDAARESDPLRTHTFNHAGYRAMLAAAPTPPAQAADSVTAPAGGAVAEVVMAIRPPKASPAWLPHKIIHASLQWLDSVPVGTKLYATTPAPADSVTAPAYSIDADPQGIRARVAEAITGALAFGAQGANPPPTGHWLVPFWETAREEASRNRPVSSDTLYLLRRLLSNQHTLTGSEFREELTKIVGEATQAADSVLEDAARWQVLQSPDDDTITEAMEVSCASRPSVDDESYVRNILKVFVDAARKQGGAT